MATRLRLPWPGLAFAVPRCFPRARRRRSAAGTPSPGRLPGHRRPTPMRQVTRATASNWLPDGLARFLDRGTWFADAHYGHAFTVTAAGHATMLSGAYPHKSGIIGNEWRDPVDGEMTYCTGDTSATYIGNETKKLDGASPKNLRVEMVGDVLRRVDSALQGDRHLGQGSRLDPARRQDRHGLHVHGAERRLRVEHVLHAEASCMGRRIQRRQARRHATSEVDWTPTLGRGGLRRSRSPDQPAPGSAPGRASCR